jgi:predicted nucleic acid-binding Zn ribbon protein
MSVTRTYQCTATGAHFDVEQRMTDGSIPECPKCADLTCIPIRIINCEGAIHFRSGPSGGWASSGYSKSEPERRAEHQLGRKLTKSEK